MPSSYFQFRQFRIHQEKSGMKVTTDACLFGAWVANEIRRTLEPQKILDIGAGTGLLSMMLAQVTSSSQITAIEINEQSYYEAKNNFEGSHWSQRLELHYQSLQEFSTNQKYDLIICNPPFFKNSQRGQNKNKNQALHMEDLSPTALLEKVVLLLNPQGLLWLLYPEREMFDFTRLANKEGVFLQQSVRVKNQEGGPVFRMVCAFDRKQKNHHYSSELAIRRADGTYTDAFWQLLKEYYLEYNDPEKTYLKYNYPEKS